MASDFFNYTEHLIEDQIPEQLKTILLLTGYSCRTAFVNAPETWHEDIEQFIRSQSEYDYYRNRLPYGLNLKHFSLPPGFKSILNGIKAKFECGGNASIESGQQQQQHLPAICQPRQDSQIELTTQENYLATPSTSTNSQQKFKIPQFTTGEATDILDNLLKIWRKSHNIKHQIKYNMSNKQIINEIGEHITKISATVLCPECDKSIHIYMDDLKRRWVLSNFTSHFNRIHRRDQQNNRTDSNNSTSQQDTSYNFEYYSAAQICKNENELSGNDTS